MSVSEQFEPDETNSEKASLPEGLDEASLQLLSRLTGKPFAEDLPLLKARQQMREGQSTRFHHYALSRESHTYAGCEIEILRVREATSPLPVVFFMHGGGWVMGDTKTHVYLIAELAARSGHAIVSINYPLAPEIQYPESLHIAFAAILEVLAASSKHRIDPERFAVAGDSAGGNMAAALTLRFRRERLPAPRVQILLYPALDALASSNSYKIFSKGLNLTERTMHWFWNQYASGIEVADDPFLSPLYAPDEMLSDLPSTLIITSEFDVLRDEGELYARRLRNSGVTTCSVRMGGVLHGFMVTESLAKSPSGDTAIQLVTNYLRNHLS